MNIFPNSITASSNGNDNTTLTSEADTPTIIKILQSKKQMHMKRSQELEMRVHTLETSSTQQNCKQRYNFDPSNNKVRNTLLLLNGLISLGRMRQTQSTYTMKFAKC